MQDWNRRTLLKAGLVALATPTILRTARADDKTINIYNWADYIGETTIADFEAATGIKAVYDFYDSSEAAEAKLMAGASGYDVVFIASRSVPRFLDAKILQPLDKSKLPNLSHLDPDILKLVAALDPDNAHTVPYMWGTTGVTYNTDMVDQAVPNAPYSSLSMIFDPQIAAKLTGCGINMINSPASVVPMILAYLGKDPMSEDPKDLDAVIAAFDKVRGEIRSFDNNLYTTQLANQELCVTTNWAGDYAVAKSRAKEAGSDVNLRYEVPETGGSMWLDTMIIPADAANAESAHAFIDYMMQPEVIAKATNYTSYANANKDAAPFIDKAILENPAVYPDAAVKQRIWLQKAPSPEYEAARVRAWSRIMRGA